MRSENASEKTRILFVVNGHEYTAAHRLPVLRGALDAGYHVSCVAPDQSPAFERLKKEGWDCHSLPLTRRGTHPLDEVRSLRALSRIYRTLKPDLVHHATIKPVLYGSLAARWARVPAVVNAITGLGYVYTSESRRAQVLRAIVNILYRAAFRHPNQRVIFQNADNRGALLQAGVLDSEQSVIVPGSGVDVNRFYPAPEPDSAQLIVILPARMLWDKGVGEFVEAARRLKQEGCDARFALVGDLDAGNPEAITEQQLQQWVQEGVIEWWGPQTEMARIYQQSHIVVLPSYAEGMPKVVMEAAACGRAAITTDAPGCRETVDDGLSGFLVPPRDSEHLTARLRKLLQSADMRKRMGQAGRKKATREFADTQVIERTLEVYKTLLHTAQDTRS